MNQTNNLLARESYKNAKQIFFKAFRKDFNNNDGETMEFVEGLKMSQSELRLEAEITAAANVIRFGVNDVSNAVRYPTEFRLNQNDALVASEFQLFVCRPASATAVAHLLATYGNRSIFTANAAAALDSTFYAHGRLVVRVNQNTVVMNRGLINFYHRPETQQTAAYGTDSPGDQLHGAEAATIVFEPNLILLGNANNEISIELPGNLAAVDAGSRVVLIVKGIYAQDVKKS